MAVSVAPALCVALMAVASAQCPTAQVYYAVIDNNAPGDAFVVNATDLTGEDWSETLTSARDWETVGINSDVNETGEIPCVIRSWSGNGDSGGQLAAMQAAYAMAEAFASSLRSDPTVGGIAGLEWVLFGSDTTLSHRADPQMGSEAELAFSVHYQALI